MFESKIEHRIRWLPLTRWEASGKADSDGTDVAEKHSKCLATDSNAYIWFLNLFLEYFHLSYGEIVQLPIHQNIETSGFDSVATTFRISFVATELYWRSSSAIELDLFDSVSTNLSLVEIVGTMATTFFVDEMFRGEEADTWC